MKPRCRIGLLLVLAAFSAALAGPRVVSVGTTVSDLDRSVAFYTDVLGFERRGEREIAGEAWEELEGVFGLHARVAELTLGDEHFELTEYLAPRGRAVPQDSRSNDLWFQHIAIVVSDIDAAYARLREHHVRHVSSGPQTLPDWNPAAGGIRAFYFQDPDGHNLEIIWYPPGKGDPRWQRRDGRLFLGIDHTAIGVSDTEAGLAFYRDLLGLQVAGTSENWGTEQEHLNMVFGARLRITALRGESGPGIEFLEYLSPRGGRRAPDDLAANDVVHWQTGIAGVDPVVLWPRLHSAGGRAVSPGSVTLDGRELGYGHAALTRDPDGHGILLVAP